MRICALTCGYNEHHNLPIWLRHYGRELGPENCVVIDRGSSHLPPLGGASLLQTPAAPLDENKRVRTIRSVAEAMLEHYDMVVYSDTDELLVADPAKYTGLREFFTHTDARAHTAAGLDLFHKFDVEDPIDALRPILQQRSFGLFNSWLCKTLATQDLLQWSGGFHWSSAPPVFSGLYMFHASMADLGERLKRAAALRTFAVVDEAVAPHHRFPLIWNVQMMLNVTGFEVRDDFDIEIPELMRRTIGGARLNGNGLYEFTEEVKAPYLLRIPERFQNAA